MKIKDSMLYEPIVIEYLFENETVLKVGFLAHKLSPAQKILDGYVFISREKTLNVEENRLFDVYRFYNPNKKMYEKAEGQELTKDMTWI